MQHERIKDEFIKYWNDHYHNLIMPIQKKHELKKVAWEFWKESKHEVIYMTAEEYDKYLNEAKEKMEFQKKYDELGSQMQDMIKKLTEQKIEIERLTKQRNELATRISEIDFNNRQRNRLFRSNDELEKENAELKEQIEIKDKTLESYAINSIAEREKYEKQIERMKCCENCKHWIEQLDNNGEPYLCCEIWEQQSYCEDMDEWELAE